MMQILIIADYSDFVFQTQIIIRQSKSIKQKSEKITKYNT